MMISNRDTEYKSVIKRYFVGEPAKEIDFFINPRRFEPLMSVIGESLHKRPLRLLDAACGPFAFEHYVPLPGAEIDAFDPDQRLQWLHTELLERKLISPCRFTCCGLQDHVSASKKYDIVLINDVYCFKHVDFYSTIPELAASVAPGGVLYFDVQDERAGPLWRAMGKDHRFRRYALPDVRQKLVSLGFDVETLFPVPSVKGGADSIARSLLWRGFGIANNFAFVARQHL